MEIIIFATYGSIRIRIPQYDRERAICNTFRHGRQQ